MEKNLNSPFVDKSATRATMEQTRKSFLRVGLFRSLSGGGGWMTDFWDQQDRWLMAWSGDCRSALIGCLGWWRRSKCNGSSNLKPHQELISEYAEPADVFQQLYLHVIVSYDKLFTKCNNISKLFLQLDADFTCNILVLFSFQWSWWNFSYFLEIILLSNGIAGSVVIHQCIKKC